jgi:hypothetical protein
MPKTVVIEEIQCTSIIGSERWVSPQPELRAIEVG